jgi:hypothetical protein
MNHDLTERNCSQHAFKSSISSRQDTKKFPMENLLSTIDQVPDPLAFTTMKFVHIRSAAAVFLLSLLTACGGSDFKAGAPMAQAAAASAQNPAPDCQPENCQGLRIVDGNAETYRFDAARRTAAEAGATI